MFSASLHRHIYLVLLALLGGCMVTSTWASNLVWVLLGANWLFEGWARPSENGEATGRWSEKWKRARESRLLHAFVVLYAVHLVGLFWTSNVAHGLSMLQVKLPLLVVPLVMLTSEPVKGRSLKLILALYSAVVVVVSVIGVVRLLTIADLPYRDAVPYISHIRFALNCCMVIFIAFNTKWSPTRRPWTLLLRALVILWMLFFLVMIRSYTALGILAVVSLVFAIKQLAQRRWLPLALWVAVGGAAAILVGHDIKAYYHMVPSASAPLQAYTAGGRPYSHAQDGIVENGNYINNYVCSEELRTEWERRSAIPYDSLVADGYSIQPTLVRYLNALGLTKDSVGVNALTDSQLADIEHGIANPVYASRNTLRKMVYVMLFEREFYLHTHAVKGFTLLQRFELWKATLRVVDDNRWVGVGTGDVDDALHAELAATSSDLTGTYKSTHNQYLAFLAAFGVVGFALLLIMFLRPLKTQKGELGALMLAWLLTILISCVTEDTLCTLAGILFCTWFLAFRTDNATQ